MLIFLVCLLPVLASVFEPTLADYVVYIDKNTLKDIRVIGDPVLNLSSRNIWTLEKNTFNHLYYLESLDLCNNSLTVLPEFIFSNLTKLKRLSLANNQIQKLRNSFVGLENLQLLDISRNPIKHLTRGSLYGLPNFARIFIDGNKFESFSTDMSRIYLYENKQFARITGETVNKSERMITINDDTESQNAKSCRVLNEDVRLQLCKSNGIVTMLTIFWENEELSEGCVSIDVLRRHIDLHNQNITGFQQNWYRLHFLQIDSLDLSNNSIAEIRKETLNNLPIGLTYVNFEHNQIRTIRSGAIEKSHLKHLNFNNNFIEEIQYNAFKNTRLHILILFGNQLKNLDFVSTLPDTMISLILSRNRISSIPNNAFSRLTNLIFLSLWENKIKTLQNDIFRNLTSLQTLLLARNNITTIEPAAFKGLTSLKTLDMQRNFIRDLQVNFAELTALKKLDLSWNRIIKVSFTDLPRTLDILHLDFNHISVLEKDSFVEVPRTMLFLTGNNISRIARGAFNLPTLSKLHLGQNSLTTIEGDSYEGLNRLRHLWLSQNQISEIRKGSCKHFESLYLLDISSNPLQELKAGALYGLNTVAEERDSPVFIYNNNLKEMQAGLFDI